MPWKGEKNPYKIWLSEIILQQTRVEQGLIYYKKFIEHFPDIHKLAAAKDEDVFKLWEGLGYYNRCRHLLDTARGISKKRNGIFPATYNEILSLKGVGNYTAAAIASFAYRLPYAVVDGNVFRVLSRVFGISKAVDSSGGKKYFEELANCLLDKKEPGIYNQALMDFGAVVCKPANPLCNQCSFRKHCYAFHHDLTDKLPLKKKKIKIKVRWFYYLVLNRNGKTYISQRTGKDIWRNLYEFPMLEAKNKSTPEKIIKKAIEKGLLKIGSFNISHISAVYSQQLSHQKIMGQFIEIKVLQPVSISGFTPVTSKQLSRFAFPKLLNIYLTERK